MRMFTRLRADFSAKSVKKDKRQKTIMHNVPTNRSAGIDNFRMVAALLIIAIHTAPLSSLSETADIVFTLIFARIAVPFFLMITGYFLLPRYAKRNAADKSPLIRFFKKTAALYGAAIVLYLPVNLYAGHFTGENGMIRFLKALFFEGTMYHLWYLPASMLGVALLYPLLRRFDYRLVAGLTFILYLFGLPGDSYYGLIAGRPVLSLLYNAIFAISGYTRNGLFYAPVFLMLGVLARKCEKPLSRRSSSMGFAISLAAMIAEGITVHAFGLPRHDSMYLCLPPCMYFLFHLLLTVNGHEYKLLRQYSALVYLVHPMIIVMVRGFAKLVKQQSLFVENSLVHYLLVCLASLLFAVIAVRLFEHLRRKPRIESRAWVEINLKNLRHNVSELRRVLPDCCALMAVVKADAYGHGAVKVSRELNRMGIKDFCVATVSEGMELRKGGVKGEILILGFTHPADFDLLRRYRLTQTVIDYDYAVLLKGYGKPVKVHVKIDTGMHRMGEWVENIDKIVKIFKCKNLQVEGIYTHLSISDSTEEAAADFTLKQITRFQTALDELTERGFKRPKTHIQSSYGVLNYPDLRCDYARVGIALYGAIDKSLLFRQNDLDLQPVLSVKARVGLVRIVPAGEAVGYGLQYAAPYDMRIAVLTIGYADGLARSLSGTAAWVMINDSKAPIIGRVCMDCLLVDITAIECVPLYNTAVIMGGSIPAALSATQIAELDGTIPNEFLSRLGERLERKYNIPC